MSGPRAIDSALDLARMPALAISGAIHELPPDLLDVMRIAAAQPEACRAAEERTGKPTDTLIEAARFYLQQTLFHPDADAFRVLGLAPGASRGAARVHMSCLLQWLHPDRNSGLDAIYAERVLKAWREVASPPDGSAPAPEWVRPRAAPSSRPAARSRRAREIPWVATPRPARRAKSRRKLRRFVMVGILVAAVIGAAVAAVQFGGLRTDGGPLEAITLHLPIRLSLP